MSIPPPIVLASASPRRRELLKSAGIAFVVRPAEIAEVPHQHESPRGFAERMAREKAWAVRSTNTGEVILAADTVVAVDGQILGKPNNEEDAARMLRLLSGREHLVITGVCLSGEDFEDIRSENTEVRFKKMSDADIRGYIATGEPMDKAGAYGIQGGASRWIAGITGDYNNVVGLPLDLVRQMLREHGMA